MFPDPWSPGDFAECLAAGMSILVAEQDAELIGYVVGRSVLDEAEILNVGVAPSARRHGVARALVRALLGGFAGAGVHSVFLEVRESNHPARALYASFGFRVVGRRPRYYRRPVEDAVILRTDISADLVSA